MPYDVHPNVKPLRLQLRQLPTSHPQGNDCSEITTQVLQRYGSLRGELELQLAIDDAGLGNQLRYGKVSGCLSNLGIRTAYLEFDVAAKQE